ncbi:unnamed protein product, partial [Symbiodinium pilosum]
MPQVLRAMQDQHWQVRLRAVEAVCRGGFPAAEAVTQLINALEDQNGLVRKASTVALGEMGLVAVAALPQLIRTLQDEDWQVRKGATEALGEMVPAAVEAVPQLTKALEDGHPAVRKGAAEALGKIAPAVAEVPQLFHILQVQHESSEVRLSAAEALRVMGHEVEAVDQEDWYMRKDTAKAFPGVEMEPALVNKWAHLISPLEARDARVLAALAKVYCALDPGAAGSLLQLICALLDGQINACRTSHKVAYEDRRWQLRLRAIEAFSRMSPAAAEAVPHLTKALEDQNLIFHAVAAKALCPFYPAAAEAVPQLIKALEDQRSRVITEAAKSLSKTKPTALSLQYLGPALAGADPREHAHGVLLQLVLSTKSCNEHLTNPIIAMAVQNAIWYSNNEDVVRSAVYALPAILEAADLDDFKLRGLLQRALRMVPDAVVQ